MAEKHLLIRPVSSLTIPDFFLSFFVPLQMTWIIQADWRGRSKIKLGRSPDVRKSKACDQKVAGWKSSNMGGNVGEEN